MAQVEQPKSLFEIASKRILGLDRTPINISPLPPIVRKMLITRHIKSYDTLRIHNYVINYIHWLSRYSANFKMKYFYNFSEEPSIYTLKLVDIVLNKEFTLCILYNYYTAMCNDLIINLKLYSDLCPDGAILDFFNKKYVKINDKDKCIIVRRDDKCVIL